MALHLSVHKGIYKAAMKIIVAGASRHYLSSRPFTSRGAPALACLAHKYSHAAALAKEILGLSSSTKPTDDQIDYVRDAILSMAA